MIIDEGRKNKVLMCGYPKTGNTWTMYIIANYFNILNFDAKKTLNEAHVFSKLRQPYLLRHGRESSAELPLTFPEGFPSFNHTHNPVSVTRRYGFFGKFDKYVYLYRNPYDTLISLFYRVKKAHNEIGKPLKDYIKVRINKYIRHVRENIKLADVLLYYDDLRKDPNGFRKVLELLVDEIDEDVFKKAIELSSFENIHKNVELKRKALREKEGKSYGIKTRNGRVGQYKEVFTEEQINFIKKKWKVLGL